MSELVQHLLLAGSALGVVASGIYLARRLASERAGAAAPHKHYIRLLEDKLAETVGQVELHKRRGDELFSVISGIEKERDQWQRLYQTASHHASVAQAWLARDLGAATAVANAYAARLRASGESVSDLTIDRQLSDVVEQFSTQHPNGASVVRAPSLAVASSLPEPALPAEPDLPPAAE